MPPEGKYTNLPPRPQRDAYKSAPSPLTRGSPTPRLSKLSAEIPTRYKDPYAFWSPKRRASAERSYLKDDPVIVDVPEPDKAHPEVLSPSSSSRPAPPRLQKPHTMPTGYMPQTQSLATTPLPPREPLGRPFRTQPEHEYNRPVDKHRAARRQTSFDDDLPRYYEAPIHTKYHVTSRDRGVPRVTNAKPTDSYAVNFYTDSDSDGLPRIPRQPRFPYRARPPPPPPPLDDPLYTDEDVEPSDSGSEVGRAHRAGAVYGRPLNTARYQNVNIRTAEPPPGWAPSRRERERERERERRERLERLDRLERERDRDRDSDSDGDSDSDDSIYMSMPDTSKTLATSLLSQSNSGMSASHGGLSRGRQFLHPLKARRLAGVANRDTISKDNTIGDEARTADILANRGKKICKTPQ